MAWAVAHALAVVATYLTTNERQLCASTCKLWSGILKMEWRGRAHHWNMAATAANVIDVVNQCGQCRSKKRIWSYKQAQTLGNDLYFVASGIRLSCLVDCMNLTAAAATTLLAVLTKAFPAFAHVVTLLIDDNVFYVHRLHFIQAKLVDIAYNASNLELVNIAKPHANSVPTICLDASPSTVHFLRSLVSSLAMIPPPSALDLTTITPSLPPTAVAGLVLNYPVVYTFSSQPPPPTDNALAMQPLVVFELVISDVNTGHTHSLVKYSLPQLLVTHPNHVAVMRANLLVACRRHILHHEATSSTMSVHVTTITLSSVAL
ncbi:hypothetical protein H257_04195 [Aphanomyces astaci]|uniref:Uncharacterized protein n=1 Tax=Aphanomyces astaci TaxID=112090 RepID=W4GWS3_APHAT|nr:hypothetical protein H257_04195 [Aphanomyces astaci]ETV83474.1 hypothetical protein H257_04195 [Aphanomyces astaci]|eukprot:XP_009826904.1 hypothetical protein H257_04195 [Aphanomyces astaci]